jgi:HlyD family secretion protein
MAQIQDTSGQDRVIEHRGLSRPTVVALGVLVIVLGAAAPFYSKFERWFRAEASFDRERLRTAQVERGTLVRDLSVEGRIVASSYPTLYSPAQGTISLLVKAGEPVVAGQRLAHITSPEIENERRQEESNLAALEAELSSQEVTTRSTNLTNQQDVELKALQMDAARREAERAERSHAEGLTDERELEERHDASAIADLEHRHALQFAELEIERLEHELVNKRNQAQRQRLVLEDVERRLEELEITAPVDGVVGSLSVDPRDIVIKNQVLMTVIDLSAFEIEISIPETYADDILPGVAAEILHEGTAYVGMVSSVAPEVQNSTVEGRVVFRGDQPTTLRQSQRVSTRIILSSRADVLKLRRGPFMESGGGSTAYLVQGGFAVSTAIETGTRSLTEVEIISGLNVGDTVIISDTNRFEGAETVLLRE